MCGIGFILGNTNNNFSHQLKKLLIYQKHRGPDHNDFYYRNLKENIKIGFSHTRIISFRFK